MAFTKIQENQVSKQLDNHKNAIGLRQVLLADNGPSLNLIVDKDVFNPNIMSSGTYLVRFLYSNQNLYDGKICLDMGCGIGVQGITMALYGAKSVELVDINPKAIANTTKNLSRLCIKNSKAYESDLFGHLPKNKIYEFITFNHPFFSGDADEFKKEFRYDSMLKRSMLGGTELIKRFLEQVRDHMTDQSLLVMPFFHFAGEENDPANHVANYGLKTAKINVVSSKEGLQLGAFSIYEICRK